MSGPCSVCGSVNHGGLENPVVLFNLSELAARLNLVLEADAERANFVLGSSLAHAGYASVGHFISQLGLPRGIDPTTPPDALKNVKFLVPVIEEQRIRRFEALTGEELQEKHAKDSQKAAMDAQGTKLQ